MFGIKRLTRTVELLDYHIHYLENKIGELKRDVERNQKSVVNAFTMLRKPTEVKTDPAPQRYRAQDGTEWVWSTSGWLPVPAFQTDPLPTSYRDHDGNVWQWRHNEWYCVVPAIGQETGNQNVASGISLKRKN